MEHEIPLELFFEHDFRLNAEPFYVQLPTGWGHKQQNIKQVPGKLQAKIRVLAIVAKQEIPIQLKNELVIVTIDELPRNCLLIDNDRETLSLSVLTSIHFYRKTLKGPLKLKLFNGGSAFLFPNRGVSRLSIGLRTFPFNEELSDLLIRLHFHIQLYDF